MNKAVWTVGFGVVLGFLLFLLYDVMRDDDGGGKLFDLKADTLSVNKGNADVEAINERLSSLEDSLSFMSQTLEKMNGKLSQLSVASANLDSSSSPAPADKGNRVPIPAGTVKRDEPVEGKKNWMDFVDGSIAKALVEYGLTPYDRDVPPLVRRASDCLREIESECGKMRHAFNEKWAGVEFAGEDDPAKSQFRAEWNAPSEWRRKERALILESFRASLAELEKSR